MLWAPLVVVGEEGNFGLLIQIGGNGRYVVGREEGLRGGSGAPKRLKPQQRLLTLYRVSRGYRRFIMV